jgi:hypothetical protein
VLLRHWRGMRADSRRTVAVVLSVVVAAAVVAIVGLTANRGTGGQVGAKRSLRAAVPLSSVPTPAVPAAKIHGWITATASGITDDSGQAIRLTGVADARMNQCKPSVPSDNEAATLQRLGFNSVRLAISWAATEPSPPTRAADGSWTHHWDRGYLAQVDQAVSVFRAHGIAVILDLHQVRLSSAFDSSKCTNMGLPAWVFAGQHAKQLAVCSFFTNVAAPDAPDIPPYDAIAAVWKFYAQHYAADSTVIAADVYNEPYVPAACPNVQKENLPRFYGAVGTAIRVVNPKLTLVLEDAAYETYQRAGLQLSSLPALGNIIYSWHFYPTSWLVGEPELAAHLARARALGAPLWLGEFNAFGPASNNGSPPDANAQSDLAAMMAYCRSNGIGWDLWEYRGRSSSLIDLETGLPKDALARGLQAGL